MKKTTQSQILGYLSRRKTPATVSQVRSKLAGLNGETVRRALYNLVDEGKLQISEVTSKTSNERSGFSRV